MLLMQAQENRVVLDEEQLMFITGGQDNVVDEDVDEPPIQDLALNVDNVFQADDYDAFDSDIDEAPTAQTMFMENLSSADHVYDEASPSYDSDILSEATQCVSANEQNKVVNASLTAELARYKEQVELELHSVKLQLNSTINHNKSMVAEVTSLKKDFKQKENKYLEEFLDMKALKEKVKDRLFKQDQSLQTVHMLCKPKPHYDEQRKVIPFFKTIKEHSEGIQKALINEIKEMKEVFDQMEAEVDQNVVDKKCDEIERKNLLNENKNLITKCLSKEVFYTATESVLTVSRFSNMHDAFTTAHKRIAKLEAENSNLTHKIQNDDLNENDKNIFPNLREADPILDFKALDSQSKDLNAKVNALQDLNERLRAENEKIKEKTKCVTMLDPVKPKVLAPGMYAIDVEPIPPRNRNNREVHLDYLKHLKESVETLREIVEEARAEKPLDSSLAYACLYTKHSQELLEYVIGTCLKDFNKRDRKIATAPLIRKKRVTFLEPCETSTHNTQTHVDQQKMKKTNEPGIPFTRVKVKHLKFVKKPPVKKVWRVKQVKQVWQATRKLFVGYQWKPTRRKFTLGEQCPLTRFTKSKVVPVNQPENVHTSESVITERFSDTSQKQLARTPTDIRDPTYQTLHTRLFLNAGRTDRPLVFGLRLLKKRDGESLTTQEFREKVNRDSSSEGSGIIPKVLDEPKDNSEVTEKQAGNVQTSLTLSSAKLEIQSMVDVPIHQEDPAVQRTPLIDTVTSMVADKTTSTPTPPTTQAQVQMCSTSCWKDSQENLESFVGERLRDVDYGLIQRLE
ncbi:hypothetical protein Tco_0733870 [Tanacetum coccineum]